MIDIPHASPGNPAMQEKRSPVDLGNQLDCSDVGAADSTFPPARVSQSTHGAGVKVCRQCNLLLPLEDFYPRWKGERWPSTCGRRSWCKRCTIKKVQHRRRRAVVWESMGGGAC